MVWNRSNGRKRSKKFQRHLNYGEDCQCEFDVPKDFKCSCGWNSNITLKEHKAFQDFRVVSKLGINGPLIMTIHRRHKSQGIRGSLRKPDSEFYTK